VPFRYTIEPLGDYNFLITRWSRTRSTGRPHLTLDSNFHS